MSSPPPAPFQTAGATREQVWNDLLHHRAATYPLPPHGHHPNFVGAAKAAEMLLTHPSILAQTCLIVGAERALYPLRKQALSAGKVLYIPDQVREGWYWRVTDPKGAALKAAREVGEPKLKPEGAQAVVLACVAADERGKRLSKGFGWAWAGLAELELPTYTLAHHRMLMPLLPCLPDSRVSLIGTVEGVVECQPFPVESNLSARGDR